MLDDDVRQTTGGSFVPAADLTHESPTREVRVRPGSLQIVGLVSHTGQRLGDTGADREPHLSKLTDGFFSRAVQAARDMEPVLAAVGPREGKTASACRWPYQLSASVESEIRHLRRHGSADVRYQTGQVNGLIGKRKSRGDRADYREKWKCHAAGHGSDISSPLQ